MNIEQRNAEILHILAARAIVNSATPALARAALIKDGIYTPMGNLRARFGGRGAKAA